MKRLEVAPERLQRWLDRFGEGHAGIGAVAAADFQVVVRAGDGSVAACEVPFPPLVIDAVRPYGGLIDHALRGRRIGLILVRRGGWAVGVAEGRRLAESKVGRRYVQSRTAAGGWSQQRFARRRESQTAGLLTDVAAAAATLLNPTAVRLDAVVVGGDRLLLKALMADRRLDPIRALVADRALDVPDPRRDVLEQAVDQGRAVRITLRPPT